MEGTGIIIRQVKLSDLSEYILEDPTLNEAITRHADSVASDEQSRSIFNNSLTVTIGASKQAYVAVYEGVDLPQYTRRD
jgi:hypothetical protein